MTRTVVALFDNFQHASMAVNDLVDSGFSRQDISLMASDAEGEYGRYLDTDMRVEEESGAAEGAGVGAGIGAVVGGLGGLLVGLGALTIPGIGPVLAAGPLAAALTGLAGAGVGAVAGGVTGGLLGALVDLGVPEESAQYYAEGVRRGGTLVTVRTPDDMTDRAVDILNRHDPVDINQRATQWRDEGWTGFDPDADLYTSRRERGYEQGGLDTIESDPTTDRDAYGRTGTGMGAGTGDYDRTTMDRGDVGRDYERADYGTGSTGGLDTDRSAYNQDFSSQYQDYDTYAPTFRTHFDSNMASAGYSYDQYEPAYRYGYDLATNDRFRDLGAWNEVEPEARRYWDERNPGTWERFKQAVRHAWEEVKDAVD
jgi:hypothetical protein